MTWRAWFVPLALTPLLLACRSDTEAPTAPVAEPPATTTSADTEGDPLEGTWQTDVISQAEAEKTLKEHGLGQHIEDFRPLSPIQRDTVLILHLHRGEWDLYGKAEGGARKEIDFDAAYTVLGDEVVVAHADGATTFRWSVEGGTLTLTWLSTSLPPYKGLPDEAFQRVLYMTRAFERVD